MGFVAIRLSEDLKKTFPFSSMDLGHLRRFLHEINVSFVPILFNFSLAVESSLLQSLGNLIAELLDPFHPSLAAYTVYHCKSVMTPPVISILISMFFMSIMTWKTYCKYVYPLRVPGDLIQKVQKVYVVKKLGACKKPGGVSQASLVSNHHASQALWHFSLMLLNNSCFLVLRLYGFAC